MRNFRELIDRWSTMAEFAADMGVSPNTAAGWYRRYSVPSKYWELLLAKASERKVKVTAKDLVALASKAA